MSHTSLSCDFGSGMLKTGVFSFCCGGSMGPNLGVICMITEEFIYTHCGRLIWNSHGINDH